MLFFLTCSYLYPSPRMMHIPNGLLKIRDNQYSISEFEVSDTKITIADWEEYIYETNKTSIKDFENQLCKSLDSSLIKIDKNWPVFEITWTDAAKFCNWLSEKDGFKKCYYYEDDPNKKTGIKIDYAANGYRMPCVREWLYLSEIYENKADDYYKKVNMIGLTSDKITPFPVKEQNPNTFGLYDVIGNVPEFCNDYYNENFNFKDFSNLPFGPDNFTPDQDEVYFKEYLHDVRCVAGGYWFYSYEKIIKNLINPINVIDKDYFSFRIVRIP